MRTWIAIPTLGAACAGVATGLAALRDPHAIDPLLLVAAGLAGAAIAAAVRALTQESPASLVAMILAPLLAIITIFELGVAGPRELVAIAAGAWTCVELARPSTSAFRARTVALLPAVVATVLDPAFAVMTPIAAIRVLTAWDRPRWAIAIPIAGVIAFLVRIGLYESQTVVASVDVAAHAIQLADALGPLMATAAIAGLAVLVRPRHAEIALLLSIAFAWFAGARSGAAGATPTLCALAALSAGLAICRFAALIRLAPGQAFVGATAAAILLLAPAWSILAR
ncbi:MAG: hypothetical protein ACKV2T_12975 [Kofleriaceae bacterium]